MKDLKDLTVVELRKLVIEMARDTAILSSRNWNSDKELEKINDVLADYEVQTSTTKGE